MDSSKLADRLRSIVGGAGRPAAGDALVGVDHSREAVRAQPEGILGGGWQRRDGARCFVVERRFDPAAPHGREPVKSIAARLEAASSQAPLVMRPADVARAIDGPMVFLDLETTGLSGGAGTVAFLVGFGSFAEDGAFVTRQFVLLRHADERQLLEMVGHELANAGVLVTFNGKAFDAPVIETRYLFHRLAWTGAGLPHLDVLHPARRFWGDLNGDTGCSMSALEVQLLGAARRGDVPGVEIPARYFQFVRTGDAGPLAGVLQHNRLDLLSLAGLTARLLDLVRRGADAARDGREALALGRVYGRGGLPARAREAYERAFDAGTPPVRRDAARALALSYRRARRWDEAAAFWRQLLDTPACPPHLVREANHALAVHHEHRRRDLMSARAFALQSLEGLAGADTRPPAWAQAVRHRLARIDRKLNSPRTPRLDFQVEA